MTFNITEWTCNIYILTADQAAVAKLVVVIITVFTVCNVPDAASHLTLAFASTEITHSTSFSIAGKVSNIFHFNQTAWNFFIYLGCNVKFRTTLKELFSWKKTAGDKESVKGSIRTISSNIRQSHVSMSTRASLSDLSMSTSL